MSIVPPPEDDSNKPVRTRQKTEPWLVGVIVGFGISHTLLPIIVRLLGESNYSLPTFVFTPLAIGFLSALLTGIRERHSLRHAWISAFVAIGFLTAYLTFLQYEGVACLLMASPLVLLITWAGARIGHWFINMLRDFWQGPIAVSFGVLVPVFLAVSIRMAPATHAHTHETVMIVHATPERIWPLLFEMPNIPPACDFVFRLGPAYPRSITSRGSLRFCNLTTGTMPERISIRETNRRLRFEVLSTPPSMRETGLWGGVIALHNTQAFRCLAGQFLLEPLSGGRTRIRATTWYEHDYAPDAYWTLWTEAVVSGVHRQVISEIERRLNQSR